MKYYILYLFDSLNVDIECAIIAKNISYMLAYNLSMAVNKINKFILM